MQADSFLENSQSKIEKFKYPPLPIDDISEAIQLSTNRFSNPVHIKKGKGLSRKTYIHICNNKESKQETNNSAQLSLTENQVLFDIPPLEEETETLPQVDKLGRFIFDTDEGFNETVPSTFIEPIRHHHETDRNHNETEHNHVHNRDPTEQGTSSATTAAVQRPPASPKSNNSKLDLPHSNYPVVYSSVYSRAPRSPDSTHAPMMIITTMNGMNRPIVKEFPDRKFPKIHLFSCPYYTKTVFAPLPTERPPPITTFDVLKFNPPKIEMCELCRAPVKDPVEHRESETHKRRALDTNWSQIDKIIIETQNNLENWPYKPVRSHSKE